MFVVGPVAFRHYEVVTRFYAFIPAFWPVFSSEWASEQASERTRRYARIRTAGGRQRLCTARTCKTKRMANGIFENVSNHFGSLCLSPVPFSSCSLFYSSSSICSKMNWRARFCSSNKHRSEIPSFFSVRRCQVSGFLAWYMRQPKLAINREQKKNTEKRRRKHQRMKQQAITTEYPYNQRWIENTYSPSFVVHLFSVCIFLPKKKQQRNMGKIWSAH